MASQCGLQHVCCNAAFGGADQDLEGQDVLGIEPPQIALRGEVLNEGLANDGEGDSVAGLRSGESSIGGKLGVLSTLNHMAANPDNQSFIDRVRWAAASSVSGRSFKADQSLQPFDMQATPSARLQEFSGLSLSRSDENSKTSPKPSVFLSNSRESSSPLSLVRTGSQEARQPRYLQIAGSGAIVLPSDLNSRHAGKPNVLRTTKFTWATWIPKSLLFQFQRVANVFFLYIAVIVSIGSFVGSWSPKNWFSKLGPFCFILSFTACKDLYEDIRRKRDDQAENSQPVLRLNLACGDFEEVQWRDILVGDIVYVRCNEAFPADLVLLYCEEKNEAYISTVMLDGETSLKPRQAPLICEMLSVNLSNDPDLQNYFDADGNWRRMSRASERSMLRGVAKHLCSMDILLGLGPPTPTLSEVRGNINLGQGQDVKENPITEENFLARGCVLRSTPFVLAVCGYVGGDTKTRLNATHANLKFSKMQESLNWCVWLLLGFLFALCTFATVMSELVGANSEEKRYSVVVMFFRYCIVLYHAVPMSLYVMYEMMKLLLGSRVNMDPQMVDPETGLGAVARTADLMEEMGQVDFIFSDKTGTLTANEMVFAKCHLDGSGSPGDFRASTDGVLPKGVKEVRNLIGSGGERGAAAAWFFTCLAVCHTVQVQDPKSSVVSGELRSLSEEHVLSSSDLTAPTAGFDGVSPDEVAIVRAAHEVGVSFRRRDRVPGTLRSALVLEMMTSDAPPALRQYEVLSFIPFTSARKRMSVIVRDKDSMRIWCVTKGADNIMEPLCTKPLTRACRRDIKKFSQEGLRLLVLGAREVSDSYFERWWSEYSKASLILGLSKDKKIAELESKIETGLTFLGVTALEDRLQDGVPEAIETVKEAGARLWILTGDKTETCVNIARSCRLFGKSTKLVYAIEQDTVASAKAALLKCHKEIQGVQDTGLVLDGRTLTVALEDQECCELIFSLGIASRACACTRLSPMQKLKIVQLVRRISPSTVALAIGDGANDVPMIQGAHVGIGIRGKEGSQAVQACDVAISQFRFLVPLLLCHGRRSYRRISLFLNFYLYKNIVLILPDIIWMIMDRFRGRIAFPEYLSIGFNVFFTSWHIFFVLGFDHDVPDDVSNKSPELYKVGPQQQLFNVLLFSKWLAYGVLHGTMAYLIPFTALDMCASQYPDVKGEQSPYYVGSVTVFSCIILIVLLKLVVSSEQPFARVTVAPTLVALVCYLFALGVLGYTGFGHFWQPELEDVPGKVFTNLTAVLCMLLVPLFAIALDVGEEVIMRVAAPTRARPAAWKKAQDEMRVYTDLWSDE